MLLLSSKNAFLFLFQRNFFLFFALFSKCSTFIWQEFLQEINNKITADLSTQITFVVYVFSQADTIFSLVDILIIG
jgi:hypothetical protein